MKTKKQKKTSVSYIRYMPHVLVGLTLMGLVVIPQITPVKAQKVVQPQSVDVAKVTVTKPAAAPVPVTVPAPSPKPATVAPKPVARSANTPAPAPVVTPSAGSSVNSLVPVNPVTTTTPTTPAQPTTSSYYSTNWAGYMAGTGTFTQVSGSWTVPAATGNGRSTSADASWIGIGGVSTNDLIQVGTSNIISAGGQVTTSAFYEMLPSVATDIPSLTIKQGDSMSASVSEGATNQWTITITDNTSGQSFHINVSYVSAHSSAEWIQEDPSTSRNRLIPLDNFGVASFRSSQTTMNGSLVNLVGAQAQKITLVTGAGTPLATTSGISGGTSFTVSHN